MYFLVIYDDDGTELADCRVYAASLGHVKSLQTFLLDKDVDARVYEERSEREEV